MFDFNELYLLLKLMCGTALTIAHLWLVLVNHMYERLLFWFIGFAMRNGLDKVITRRVLMSVTGLMALVIIEIQSITILTFLISVFVTLVSLVLVTHEKDTSGFTEGVCLCFFASAVRRKTSISFEGGSWLLN
ncbi:hypothetical protein MKW94_018195 [Papaver nudicaule]|uniref:Uncharacterized protein n=1 Tax=Papaver nudicaule TaxID=74823 RepID=A0AA42AYN5_PAPNU|nr:hypothetical protein [Papaver nudicaule]